MFLGGAGMPTAQNAEPHLEQQTQRDVIFCSRPSAVTKWEQSVNLFIINYEINIFVSNLTFKLTSTFISRLINFHYI